MSSIKIAFFDIDGTMIDMELKKMTPLMLETLRRLKEHHIHICIATGRSPMALPHFDVEFDTFLTFNGSYCYNEQETIFSNPIPAGDIQTIIKIAAWWDRAADIIPADGGKGMAAQKILDYYHLDRSESIAFGDANNDIDMLKAVGTGVAMGNASEELKKVADDVCGHVAEDGIYHYCIEHQLI